MNEAGPRKGTRKHSINFFVFPAQILGPSFSMHNIDNLLLFKNRVGEGFIASTTWEYESEFGRKRYICDRCLSILGVVGRTLEIQLEYLL